MIKILLVSCALIFGARLETDKSYNRPRVCIIGAGVGGLSAGRHLKEAGIQFEILEATNFVGGTWRYDERTGNDEYGLPILTSMYKNLRTNLPKIAMELPGFPMPKDTPSFLHWYNYYDYLKAYTKQFDLRKNIKFLYRVTSVKRVEYIWKVTYEHVPTRKQFQDTFDYVIVASGHFSLPHMPNIPGEKHFKGTIIHSHDYRVPEPYTCKRVLVIGAGPSGLDIGMDVASVSKTLLHSHHFRAKLRTPYPANYIMKPDVKELNETGALFVDGSFSEIDDIIYATGYEYDFPFLDESSGLTITPSTIIPLHNLVLNINQPTMFILGLVTRACVVIALDAQARYATSLIKGDFIPLTREEMLDNLQKRIDILHSVGRPLSHLYVLATKEDDYYAVLSKESGIDRVKPVISRIHAADAQAIFDNLYTFRNYEYTVIDDKSFKMILTKTETPTINTNCTAQNI